MRNFILKVRYYCKIATQKSINNTKKEVTEQKNKLDFKSLKYQSKVPDQPHIETVPATVSVAIDSKQIKLLERLSLVDLDSEASLATLKNSIQFAQRIEKIPTEGVAPLYTVLEAEELHLREDQVTEGDCREQVLKNAKITEEDYFVAPPGNIPLEQ